jgi:FkbM family methyltransferase
MTGNTAAEDIVDWQKLSKEALAQMNQPFDLANRFFEAPLAVRRYAIGKNTETTQLNNLVPLHGVIDDFGTDASAWQGIPIVKTTDIPKDALVANCSTSISPVAVLGHLAKHGLFNVVGLHQLIAASAGKLAWPWFVATMHKELNEHADAWELLYDALADHESRQTLLDVVRYRLSCNPGYMQSYTVRVQEQYFEDFMQFSGETFVDAGGFDGDTSEGFAKRYPDYRKIILFEPSPKNMAAAKQRLSGYRDIDYRPVGLSDASGTLGFNQDAGSASAVARSAQTTVQVDTLDAAVEERVSFIKMDLEGWEMKALQGSTRHLMEHRPKLAIAVYHDSPDFRLVHQFVGEFGHDYRCYLRHYTQGWSETVMYFV